MQAQVRLQNWKSFNLTDLLPGGVTFQDPMFFDQQASNITSATKVSLSLLLVTLLVSIHE